MKKQFTVSQLCDKIETSTQYLYKVIQKPVPGQPYDPNFINYDELAKFLLRKYETETAACALLDIENISDIEIVKGSKNLTANINKVAIDDLEIDSTYVLRSHHYENTYVLRNVMELNGDMLYIFETFGDSKTTKDKYRVLTLEELSQERWSIKKA